MKVTRYLLLIIFFTCMLLPSCNKDEDKHEVVFKDDFTYEYILEDYSLYQMALDKKGNAWFITELGLLKYNENETVIYNKDNSPITDTTMIHNIAVDSKDNIWFTTTTVGFSNIRHDALIKFDGNSFTSYDSSSHPKFQFTWALCIDSEDNVLVPTGTQESFTLLKFNGINWDVISENLVDKEDVVYDIVVDRENNIWMLMDHKLVKVAGNNTTIYYPWNEVKINALQHRLAIDGTGLIYIIACDIYDYHNVGTNNPKYIT